MKIKSLILGTVAAAGLSTAPLAAGIETVLTSLDVCDAQGISGLTISSADNCLQITGGVAYEFKWGDYAGSETVVMNFARNGNNATIPDNDATGNAAAVLAAQVAAQAAWVAAQALPVTTAAEIAARNAAIAAADAQVAAANAMIADANQDWDSKVDAWLKFVGTADSSWGPASATIKFDWDRDTDVNNEVGATTEVLRIEEAYVSIGDTTKLMAGRKGSVANTGNDEPLNWLGLFNSSDVDKGVGYSVTLPTGGDVIQVVADMGNGVTIKGGLENLNGTGATAGTAVGVLEFAGNGVDANVTVLAGGILDGTIENWAIQAGMTATLDMITLVGAFAADNANYWNVLGSASLNYDMFTLAISGEATSGNEIGFGASASAEVSTGVTINAGFRWFDTDTTAISTESYQAAIQLVAAVTETVTITGEVGINGNNYAPTALSTAYGVGTLAWAPGGGFTSSIGGRFDANGAYSLTFKAAKDFE
ncbi:MAG: hypothetical protein L3J21_05500 [Devosiaceae bacterium]|nr:hypothetical protein [Devosiaceae bacterium]